MDDAILGIVSQNVNDSDLILNQRKKEKPRPKPGLMAGQLFF
jgi:hypothetical protein